MAINDIRKKDKGGPRALCIGANGSQQIIRRGTMDDLFRRIQEYCHGYVEPVLFVHRGQRYVMLVNEEGRLRGEPANRLATVIGNLTHCYGPILGNVCIVRENAEGDDFDGLTGDDVTELYLLICEIELDKAEVI